LSSSGLPIAHRARAGRISICSHLPLCEDPLRPLLVPFADCGRSEESVAVAGSSDTKATFLAEQAWPSGPRPHPASILPSPTERRCNGRMGSWRPQRRRWARPARRASGFKLSLRAVACSLQVTLKEFLLDPTFEPPLVEYTVEESDGVHRARVAFAGVSHAGAAALRSSCHAAVLLFVHARCTRILPRGGKAECRTGGFALASSKASQRGEAWTSGRQTCIVEIMLLSVVVYFATEMVRCFVSVGPVRTVFQVSPSGCDIDCLSSTAQREGNGKCTAQLEATS